MTTEELEWQTRRDRINKKLTSLPQPWTIIKYKDNLQIASLTHHAVEEYPTDNGPADYAFFVDGNLLGFLEAKRVSVGAQNVLEQAKRYSKGIKRGNGKWGPYGVPLLYSSNGENEYFLDIRKDQNLPRRISTFHTPDGINEIFAKGQNYYNINVIQSPPAFYQIRPYQVNAITAVEQAINDGKREMLVAMATGTGKTFVTVAQIYRLLKSQQFKRILFLVDRRALAAQAVREFGRFNTPSGYKFDQEYEVYSQRFQKEDFEEDEKFDPKVLPNEYLCAPTQSQTFVYVATIQRMAINLYGWERAFEQKATDPDYEEDTDKLNIPNHAFDLIIADECHRGYTSKETALWRDVLEYFDSVKIGLTATPAPHSLSLFREVIYRYTTEEAIQDGYLVDYDSVKIKSGVLMNGVFLKEGEQVGMVDPDTGKESYDELEDERQFASEEIEKKITVPDTNAKVIAELKKYTDAHEKEFGRFPKTLIFAANDISNISHADQLVEICRNTFNRGHEFVQKITGNPNVDRPLQKIRQFRNREHPAIVVTVDMLTTGVDIPCLEFIVFLRTVKSRILWTQMLGRGTRLCPDINKGSFTIFDCFDGTLIEYFKNTTDFVVEPPAKEIIPLEQVIENIYQNIDRDYFTGILIKRLLRVDREMSGEARKQFEKFIPEGNVKVFATSLRSNLKSDFTGIMKILRNKEFQELCIHYPRPQKIFWKAIEAQDTIESEVVFRVEDKLLKPQDYLVAFSEFVKTNKSQIEALEILLKRPKGWKTNVLNDLRLKLKKCDFDEDDLQKAHKIVLNKALADIISMVKHAAKQEEPVLTAEERVRFAMEKMMKGKTFSEEQKKWLEYIRLHLVQTLTIDMEDFNDQPIFSDRGGIKEAQKVFGNNLEQLIQEINYHIAA